MRREKQEDQEGARLKCSKDRHSGRSKDPKRPAKSTDDPEQNARSQEAPRTADRSASTMLTLSCSCQHGHQVERHEIPTSRYHVFADPPGAKIGNGGATLFVLEQLEAIYGGQLDQCESQAEARSGCKICKGKALSLANGGNYLVSVRLFVVAGVN